MLARLLTDGDRFGVIAFGGDAKWLLQPVRDRKLGQQLSWPKSAGQRTQNRFRRSTSNGRGLCIATAPEFTRGV